MIFKYRSPNFNDRTDKVKYLILHYTGMATGQAAIDRLCDEKYQVSAHYVIDDEGQVYALVDEEKRAWHAGASLFEGHEDLNDLSVGIELVNKGHSYEAFGVHPAYSGDYTAFPEPQMQSLISLSLAIIKRHDIKACHVIGHSDVAPLRKIDPGEKLDWQRLAKEGIGFWGAADQVQAETIYLNPEITNVSPKIIKEKLADFGYGYLDDVDQMQKSISAFQRHYRPSNFEGKMDDETFNVLENLLNQKDLILRGQV